MTRKARKRKKSGCGCSITLALCFILVACVLIFTDVFETLKHRIELQIYPLVYKEEILRASEDYNLEPEFICAVIHTESSFNPEAESPAGAKGLMQLMPETFLWLSQKRGEALDESMLTVADINIDYGCFYLRYLTDTYGNRYTACASYNAGTVVSDWLENPDYSDDGVTLHSIPYPETSGYVEKIKKTEEIYERLYFD